MQRLAPPDWSYFSAAWSVVALGLGFVLMSDYTLIGHLLAALGLLLLGYSLRPPIRSLLKIVARTHAARNAKNASASDRAKLLSAGRRLIRLYNAFAEMPPYQESASDTWAQASARAQLRAQEERRRLEDLRHYLWDYRFALKDIEPANRAIHESIAKRLGSAESLSDLHEPIREMCSLLFPQGLKP